MQISALVPEIWQFEKCAKYANEMNDDVIYSTQFYILYINRAIPTHLISICKWFSAQKTLNKATNPSKHIYMLVGSCIWGTICKYENGTPKVARNAFNIGEVWNPVCCHGNKTVKLKLWSTFSRILLQRIKHFWYKLAEISFSSYLIKIRLSVWRHHLTDLHILKTWISLEQKEIFESTKRHFSSYAGYLFMH